MGQPQPELYVAGRREVCACWRKMAPAKPRWKVAGAALRPTEGRILLDGVDLRDYDLLQLRKNIGVIFQDYLRYQMSFSQNIAVGNIEEINNQELIAGAAEKSLCQPVCAAIAQPIQPGIGPAV